MVTTQADAEQRRAEAVLLAELDPVFQQDYEDWLDLAVFGDGGEVAEDQGAADASSPPSEHVALAGGRRTEEDAEPEPEATGALTPDSEDNGSDPERWRSVSPPPTADWHPMA